MNFLDKTISVFSPEKALKRTVARSKLSQIENSGYSSHGASSTKRSFLGWLVNKGAPNDDTTANQDTLAARSRDLFYSNPLATGAIKTIRTNVVGHGLQLNSNIDHEYLGISQDAADLWEQNTEREFRMWADSVNCDISRTLTFGQLQGLALISSLMDGDVFVTLPLKKQVAVTYDLRINLVEADRVKNPPMTNNPNIIGGIECDDDGVKTACYISNQNPYSEKKKGQVVFHRVEFFGKKTGRPNILHVAQDWERPHQRRGMPLLSPVMEVVKQLGRYTEAEINNAVISGMFTVFITSNTPQNPIGSGAIPMTDPDTGKDDLIQMGAGNVVGLGDGESVEFANPTRPNSAFNDFVISISRQIGVALELPYELLVKHFTSSYSASRAALLEAWKMFKMRRHWMTQTFCQPIYEEWLSEAVAKGRIDAPGFFEDESLRKAWSKAEWYGPSQGYLNPLNEVQAAKVAVEEEFTTREKATAEMTGQPWEGVHKVRKMEEAKRRADDTIKRQEDYQPIQEQEVKD